MADRALAAEPGDQPPPAQGAEHDADHVLAAELIERGRSVGLDAVGIAAADVFESTRRILFERRSRGLSAGMGFTFRNPDRSTDPRRILVSARSLVVGALAYADADPGAAPRPSAGRVARYVRQDNYSSLHDKLGVLAAHLTDAGFQARIVIDDNALVDKEAAVRAGIGWYGKNSLLLIGRKGSYLVLGSVVTDAPLAVAPRRVDDGCGTCTRCLTACPTGAIVEPGVVDARRCLAWLLQAPGDFPEEHRVALGGRLYGCDDCQEACPPNRVQDRRAALSEDAAGWVDLVELLRSSDDELMARFGRWYIPGREARYLRRNALVALGNVGDPADPRVTAVVEGSLASPDPMIRRHAAWAASRLARDHRDDRTKATGVAVGAL